MLTQRGPAPYLIDHAPGRGAIARFDQDRYAIVTLIEWLLQQGADGFSLSPWMWAGIGDDDQYLDWDPTTGRLASQCEAGFLGLLSVLKTSGVRWIQVAPQFYDPKQPPPPASQSWPRNVGMDAFGPTWLFIYWLYEQLEALGIEFVIDAVPEFNDVYPKNPGFQDYVKAMWDNVTLTSAPGGIPCWRYSMSFITANYDALTDAFQGNVPAILLPHVYAHSGNFHDALVRNRAELVKRGMDRPHIYGETSTFQAGDEPLVQEFTSFVQETKQLVMGVCPWPIPTSWRSGDPILAPPLAPRLWSQM